jgi:PKD repeat protein
MKKYFFLGIILSFQFLFSNSLMAQSWNNVGAGTNNSSHCMTTWNGMLIDGGSYNNPCNRIAGWNGTTWSCMATGVGLVARDAIEYNGDLIVCGDFWNVQQPCVGCNGIARWDGTSWTPLGTGFNNDVLCLTIWNGELVAGGDFTQADGNPVSRIAKWNGTSWVGIGGTSDFSNDIRTMTVYDGELWVGGDFNNVAGCSACDGLVKWDDATSTWIGGDSGVDITGGVDSTVRVLFVDQASDLLYMGGHFVELTIDGVPNTNFNGMAKYDGSDWTPLGTGVNSYVRAIGKYNGNIIAGGDFNTAGAVTANKIAKWNPGTSTWSAMGTGMNDYVKSIEIWNGTLYAGGPFTTADGLTRNCIASWYEAPTLPPVAQINASSTAVCTGQCINFQDDSNNSPTTWTWTFPGGTPASSTNQDPGSVCYAMAGIYTVTLTACNVNGCNTTTQSINISNGPNVTVNNLTLCNGQNGNLTANGASTYFWSPATGLSSTIGTTVIANPTVTTVYTVTGTAVGGCTNTATATVTVNPLPTPTASNNGPYCTSQTIQLNSPTGSATDDWTGPGGYVQNNMQNPVRTGATLAMAGVYTVTVTNASGCSATATTTVVVNASPTPTATNTGPYCINQTIQLNSPSGSATDDWTGPNSYVQNNTQNPTIPLASLAMGGVYTVTVTNGSGCSATATTTVVVNTPPTPTATNTGPFCVGQTIQLSSPSGSATDDWTGPAGYVQNNIQNPGIAGATLAMAGVYTVTVTNGAGCSGTGTTTVVVNALPSPTATNTGAYCEGETIQLNSPTGSSTDDWTGPNSYSQLNSQNPSISSCTAMMAGVYTVTVTNGFGCSATATTSVTVNNAPPATASNTGPFCVGSTIDLSASGGSGYVWSGPLSFSSGIQNPSIPSSTISMSGIYTVEVTGLNGCTGTATTTVTVSNSPTASATNAGPFCEGGNIQLNATGGASYDWDGPLGFTSIDQNPIIGGATTSMSGIYTVTVSLVGGCSNSATTSVIVNALPDNSVTQNGINLSANQTGAVYQWLDCNDSYAIILGETNQAFTAIANGSYAVSVTSNGCTDTSACMVVNNVSLYEASGSVLSVYPNPFVDMVVIKMNDQLIGSSYSIMDIRGRKMMKGIIQSAIFTLNLETLSPGMYLLQVEEQPGLIIQLIKKTNY